MRVLNALGKHIGNWNDRVNHPHDWPTRRWKLLDRFCGWLYKL